jgi:NRAMP (natural resistance-associated macrophage protein)-like metal ion transporter
LRHHPARRQLRGFGYLGRLGPGLVTGASDDDPSGIGTYSQVGAQFRLGMLWMAVLSLPLAASVQEACARLGLCTGKGLAALIRERFPRWVLYGAVGLVTVANVFNIGADLGSMAAAVRLLVPVPALAVLVILAVGTIGLEVFISYHRYARVLRWFAASLLAYVAVLFAVHVDWGLVAERTLIPTLRFDRPHLAALIAILGTTISPYLFFWQASEEVEEKHDHGRHGPPDTGHLRAMRGDVVAGMISAVAIMWAIMISASNTLGRHGITTVGTADQAAQALRPIAGDVAGLLFALGIVGTGLLAVPILAGSTAFAVAETFGWREGLERRAGDAGGFYFVIAAAVVVGFVLNLTGINAIRALYFAAILNGLAAPPLILLVLILLRSRAQLGTRAGGKASTLLLAATFLVMAGAPVAYLLS